MQEEEWRLVVARRQSGAVLSDRPTRRTPDKGDLNPRPKRLMELCWAWTRATASRTARRGLADSHETEQWDTHQPIFSASSTMIPAGPRT
jgi:hypothetical protein